MSAAAERDPLFEELVSYIRDERGFDFTGYKRPSLMRRIARRMQDVKVDGFDNYKDYLAGTPDEFGHLFDTILINVTSFFRDPVAWAYVTEHVVPQILAARAPADPIRVWSTGCSTGEEAYTIAMVFAEAMSDDDFRQRVKIYATDVDDGALHLGRHATYNESQLEPVPPVLRERYFEPANGTFAFRSDLRRTVIFGRHDLVQDPPISRIDLLVSRNTLMYFDAPTQQRILSNLHFALRDDGFLFLGKSEVLVARSTLFSAVDLRRRVFAKVPSATARDRAVPRPPTEGASNALLVAAQADAIRQAGFESAPLSQLVIDRGGTLAAANMQARMLFGLSQRDIGTLLQDLELSYRPVELRSRIEQAYTDGHAVNLRDVEWHTGTEIRSVDVQVTPLTSANGEPLGVSITFTDVTRYRRLQEALQESKRDVETAYEELQSTVEELETTNEELQSTNEELETTNEELQSTNEELETINDELQQRTDELNDVNLFLEAILGSLSDAVVVVDTELRVQAWNDAARELWGLRSEEVVGKHLLNLDIGLPLDRLRAPVRAALEGEESDDFVLEAVNRRGRGVECRMRFAPLSANGGGVRGAIIMMDVGDPVAHDGA